jgi:hypothetical protein
MRDFKGIKRQRGRNRNGGGGGGGGGKPQHNTNRAFDSNGPEGVKVRGAAQHVYEKYQQLARDAHTSGDRVLAENHLQHAEHYFRLLRAMQPQRPISEIIGRDQFVSGYDIDFEDESGSGDGEMEADGADGAEGADRSDYRPAEPRQGDSRQHDGRQNDYRQGEFRPREDRYGGDRPQSDRGQGERFQNGAARNNGRDDRQRDDRPREDRSRDDRQRFNRDDRPRQDRDVQGRDREFQPRQEREARPEREVLSVVEPEATPLPIAAAALGPVLRADDGEVNHAPAFLQVRASEPRDEVDGEARRPRRRRAPRSFDAGAPVEGDDG